MGAGAGDVTRLLLVIRRVAILAVLLLGYVYFRVAGDVYALVSIGLISFAAVAQFAPAIPSGFPGATATPITMDDGSVAALLLSAALKAYDRAMTLDRRDLVPYYRAGVALSYLFYALTNVLIFMTDEEGAPAEPVTIETREQFRNALSARDVLTAPEIQLEERASSGGKGGKGGKGSGGNSSSAASDMLSPSRVLQVAALGLGVVEVVRLWS